MFADIILIKNKLLVVRFSGTVKSRLCLWLKTIFSTYSIKKKIFVTPVVTIILLFLTSVISLVGLNRQRILINEIFDKRFKLYHQSSEVVKKINIVHTNMYKGIVWQLIGYDMNSVKVLLDSQVPLIDDVISMIKNILSSEALKSDERKIFISVLNNLEEYRTRALYAIDSALEGNDITTASLILQMGDDQFWILYDSLNELMKLQSELSKESVDKSQDSVANFSVFSTIFTILALLISIALSIFIGNLIVDPVNRVIDILRKGGNKSEDLHQLESITANDEIGEFAHYFSGYISEIEATTNELVVTRDQLWGEMQLAKKIQTALVPKIPILNDYQVTAELVPAEQVGGDYFDIINVKGRDWIVIGDVSGHGVPAGLIMMMLQTSIKTVLYHEPDITPSRLLERVNEVITDNINALGEDKYITITILCRHEDGRFTYSGLHEDILIYRANSNSVEKIKTDGMWLGIKSDIEPYMQDESLMMGINDVLLLYTDGVTESFGADKKIYSRDRLIDQLKKSGKFTTNEIRDNIRDDLKSYVQHDDTTMIIMKRLV